MTVLESLLQYLEQYGVLLVFLFAMVHPLLENPWSFLTLTLAMTVLSPPLGYLVIASGTVVGVLLLYLIATSIQRKSNYYLMQKRLSQKALLWLKDTAMWRHILVIGMPSVPTYPIKIALPFTTLSFYKYMITLLGSYVFLYLANSLLYFGLIGFITDFIHPFIGSMLLVIFALYIYFGRTLHSSWHTKKER